MVRKPSTEAGGSGARQNLGCSGKNIPANKSNADSSQDNCAKNLCASRSHSAIKLDFPTTNNSAADTIAALDGELLITLVARGRERFDAIFDGKIIVQASKQAISDAARMLHRHGYCDDRLLIAQHDGARHYAMRGTLAVWRKVRIREDRGPPRHVAWEPLPRRVQGNKGRFEIRAVPPRGDEKNASAARPGAADSRSQGRLEPPKSCFKSSKQAPVRNPSTYAEILERHSDEAPLADPQQGTLDVEHRAPSELTPQPPADARRSVAS